MSVSNFPTVISAIVGLAILAGVAFSSTYRTSEKPYYFAGAIVGISIWFLIVYWFCATGNSQLGWFFLLLPILLIVIWFFSKWLDSLCYSLG